MSKEISIDKNTKKYLELINLSKMQNKLILDMTAYCKIYNITAKELIQDIITLDTMYKITYQKIEQELAKTLEKIHNQKL